MHYIRLALRDERKRLVADAQPSRKQRSAANGAEDEPFRLPVATLDGLARPSAYLSPEVEALCSLLATVNKRRCRERSDRRRRLRVVK